MILLLVFGGLLLYRLAEPFDSYIFDESYYVPMARVLLALPVGPENLPQELYSGCDPNSEHPVLAKALMALGVSFFADNGVGWRLPSVIFGMLGAFSTYQIAYHLSKDRWLARTALFLLIFDNLYFVHSRIATLDIYMVGLSLFGAWLFLLGYIEFSAIALGTASCCKINGLLWVAGLTAFYFIQRFWQNSPNWLTKTLRELGLFIFFYLSSTFFLMGALDCQFTKFPGPIAQLQYIFSYGTSLSRPVGVDPQGAESTPLQWWLNEKPFEYFALSGISDGNTKTQICFTGKMNIFLVAALPFSLVFSATKLKNRSELGLFVLCLFGATYVPFLLTWLKTRRICYIFYMVPCLPIAALGIAFASRQLPRWVTVTLYFCSLYSFASLFPFKT